MGNDPKDPKDAPPPAKLPSDEELRDKLKQARTRLLMTYPFFGYLVANLEDKIGTEWISSAGTDGQVVHWGREFLASLSMPDTMFVLAHEALHCALLHPWRRNEREARAWNWACDAAANDMLWEAGLKFSRPHLRGAKGRSAEEVYEDIAALMKANRARDILDDHEGWIEGDPHEPKQRQLADAWKAALSQVKQFGNMPAGMSRHVDALLNPKRDWRDLLRDGLFFPEDYRWVPTDRRFHEVLLPTLTGEVHRVVVAIDTSGSIQGEKLASFWTELLAILRNNRCEARVLACDTEIQNEWDEVSFDPAHVDALEGGGGTSFVPVFERVEKWAEAGWRPEAVVYLTDLDGRFPGTPPDVRTIWVVDKDDAGKKAPFGEVIALE
jgi:predicted metal-dependent peptidase